MRYNFIIKKPSNYYSFFENSEIMRRISYEENVFIEVDLEKK